jgi:hypothetical protein
MIVDWLGDDLPEACMCMDRTIGTFLYEQMMLARSGRNEDDVARKAAPVHPSES